MKILKKSVLLLIVLCGIAVVFHQPAKGKTVVVENAVQCVNPLYAKNGQDAQAVSQKIEIEAPKLQTSGYRNSVEDVVADLRQGMVERKNRITVYYQQNGKLNDEFVKDWFFQALEETGNAKEGDYLRWHWAEFGAKYQCEYYYSGNYRYAVTYQIEYYTNAQQEAEVDKAVANLIQNLQITAETTDYSIVKQVYDYVCANIKYDFDNLYDENYTLKYSAYAAMVQKKAVCQGYASLMYRILTELDISTRVISGTSYNQAHGWNLVNVDGKYYYIDATWDAEATVYEYFLRGSSNFPDHENDAEYQTDEFLSKYSISSVDYKLDVIEIYTYDQWKLLTEEESGTKFRLMNNISGPYWLYIPQNKSYQIDLNGYSVLISSKVFINDGTLTICDSKGGGELRMQTSYQSCSMVENNGTFYLKGGALVLDIATENPELVVGEPIYGIYNKGSFQMSGGEVSAQVVTKAKQIDYLVSVIFNSTYGVMGIEDGTISLYTENEVYSSDESICFTGNCIQNQGADNVKICGTEITCVDVNRNSVQNKKYFINGIYQYLNGNLQVEDIDIDIQLKGQGKLEGKSCGINKACDGSMSVDRARVNLSAADEIETQLVGIVNNGGNTIIGGNETSNSQNTKVILQGINAESYGVAHVSDIFETSDLYIQKGTIVAKVGALNEGWGNVYIGTDEEHIDDTDVKIKGTEKALLSSEDTYSGKQFEFHLMGGLYEGSLASAFLVLPEGYVMQQKETDVYVLGETTEMIEAFVTRLYEVCLGRTPDAAGKASWVQLLQTGQFTGVQAANGFVFSLEFKNKNLCNGDYIEQLYLAFMGRAADPAGKAAWVSALESGGTREAVFNGFAMSSEFGSLCTQYGIVQGSPIAVPTKGTIQQGTCAACGEEDGVTAFVKRLYDICLNREADPAGLNGWASALWDQTGTGRQAAYGFIFSAEFVNKNYSNEKYVEYLYLAFMGREADAAGKQAWVDVLNQGYSREAVFDGFVGSNEFTNICNKYGILRG